MPTIDYDMLPKARLLIYLAEFVIALFLFIFLKRFFPFVGLFVGGSGEGF